MFCATILYYYYYYVALVCCLQDLLLQGNMFRCILTTLTEPQWAHT